MPILLLALSVHFSLGDILIDDFNDGDNKNNYGGYWYYFSDVKDQGNSKILNATLLSNGSYSEVTVDIGKACAEVAFVIGDTSPSNGNDFNDKYANFVGLGMDIANPGRKVDLSGATGIRLKARSDDSLILCCELVTSNIIDNGYYCSYFTISNSWRQYTLNFANINQFAQPFFGCDGSWPEYCTFELSKVYKINWKVYAGFCKNNKSYGNLQKTSGLFAIDDIYITGIDSIPVPVSIALPVYLPAAHTSFNSWRKTFDLLGRQIPFFHAKAPGTSGICLWRTPKESQATASIKRNRCRNEN